MAPIRWLYALGVWGYALMEELVILNAVKVMLYKTVLKSRTRAAVEPSEKSGGKGDR
jgi:hypothetical protein